MGCLTIQTEQLVYGNKHINEILLYSAVIIISHYISKTIINMGNTTFEILKCVMCWMRTLFW